MKHPTPKQVFGPAVSRLGDVMAHSTQYAFRGTTRLAADARVSSSTVSRLLHGKLNPSFLLVARLTTALERSLGIHIDPRDLIAESGEFMTRFVCDLVACRGCLPERARDELGAIKSAYVAVPTGKWVCSRYPRGYRNGEEGNVR